MIESRAAIPGWEYILWSVVISRRVSSELRES